MGDIRLKSDSETVPGRSRLQGREEGAEDEEDGEADDEEDEEEKGHGKSRGLIIPKLKLLVD